MYRSSSIGSDSRPLIAFTGSVILHLFPTHQTMLSLIAVLVIGAVIGYFSWPSKKAAFAIRTIPFIIYILLFLLGTAIGHNPTIIDNLSIVGWDAFIITTGAIFGSLLAGKIIYRYLFNKQDNSNEK